MESLFEQMGGTYSEVNGYLIPDLKFPEQDRSFFSRYGRLHLKFIKENKRGFYTSLLMTGKLNQYLAEVDKTAHELLKQLINQIAKQQGVTEQLKIDDQIKWVGLMNNIKSCAEEVVFREVIYV
ncbi:MAG TPA: TnpV protein [Clostridia bacterium]|nr:TnpV protein [Clostridia bacterium]